jgi:hypothetical protein
LTRLLAVLIAASLQGTVVYGAPSRAQTSTYLDASVDPAIVGQWDGPYSWPLVGIHVTMMHTGKTLQFSYDPSSHVWDPATNSISSSQPLSRNLFCGGQSFLPDGRVIVTGGTADGPSPPVYWGLPDTHIFDPVSETWERVEDMAQGRWYPTNFTWSDGRTYVFSGLDDSGLITSNIEVYVPDSGWQSIGSIIGLPLYPALHLLSTGDVYFAGPSQTTARLTLDPVGVFDIQLANFGYRRGGVSVLLPPGGDRIMMAGGALDTTITATAEIIDLSDSAATWQYTTPMNFPREHVNAVILPDATVLVVGGHSEHHGPFDPPESTAVFEAEIFDPIAETWSIMAPMQLPRVYHSTSALLPDGRVLASGTDGLYFAEIYSPPYLFGGARPVISSSPTTMEYGSACCITFNSTTHSNKVVLIRPASETHSLDMNARYVLLDEVSCGPGHKQIEGPANPNLAPPGYYMMFVVDDNGVPSEAQWVQLVLDCEDGCDCEVGASCPASTNSLYTGDVNNDGAITSGDIVFIVGYVFKNGPSPGPCEAVGDVDCSGAVTASDIIHSVNFVFKSGPEPCDVCALIPNFWSCSP